METLREITLPETTPAMEWISGRAVQKVSPTRKHGRLQLIFGARLDEWSRGRGNVSMEWCFRVTPPASERDPLVPAVAYMSYERLRPLSPQDREIPPIAPEIVVEILSPDDRKDDVDEKRRVYLAWGVRLVLVVDPETWQMDAYERDGRCTLAASAEYSTPMFPGFLIPLQQIFAEIEIPDA